MKVRELDALVAEKVMGWRKDGGMWVRAEGRTPDGWDYASRSVLPNFTESIQWAWQIIEKVRARKDFALFNLDLVPSGLGDAWDARFMMRNGPHYASDNSAAKAICLAALKALGALPEGVFRG